MRRFFCSSSNVKVNVNATTTFFLETFGCQMNVADSEVIRSILQSKGFVESKSQSEAQVILFNTCAIREKAEQKAIERVHRARHLENKNSNRKQVIGLLGCMAERLKTQLLERTRLVDVVVGPDGYRDLPTLIGQVLDPNSAAVAFNRLSYEETYGDIAPVRSCPDGVKAFVSTSRGCNNMCAFCVVPFTRGRERSRSPDSVLKEIDVLSREQGFKEVTLLGQNVNSYFYKDNDDIEGNENVDLSQGFKNLYDGKSRKGKGTRFHDLLQSIASAHPDLRIRFTSPHPKDFPDRLLQVIANNHNVCKGVHLPLQSGSDRMLTLMRRNHTAVSYFNLVDRMKAAIPNVELSSDFIAGFCSETEQDHKDTLLALQRVQFTQAFLFAYSEREKTHAHRTMADDVSSEDKQRRLNELINAFREISAKKAAAQIGQHHIVLVESADRKRPGNMMGKNDGLRKVSFPQQNIGFIDPQSLFVDDGDRQDVKVGDFVLVKVCESAHHTLIGKAIAKSTLSGLHSFVASQSQYADSNGRDDERTKINASAEYPRS